MNWQATIQDTLLLLFSRLELSCSDITKVKQILSNGINWNQFIEKAKWHRLQALVAYHLLSPEFGEMVPQETEDQLHQIKLQSLARNILLQDELARLLILFQKQNIPVIVLKGSILLGYIYKDISLRPMGDLDILVMPQDLIRAETIALHEGYIHSQNLVNQKKIRQQHHHLPELYNQKKGIILEIHHHIIRRDKPFKVNINDFWLRSQSVDILGARAFSFSPEDMIIHLSLSLVSDLYFHNQAALGRLCDISEIIHIYKSSLNWELFEATCINNKLNSAVYLILFSCNNLLGTEIPLKLLDTLKPIEFDTATAEVFLHRRILDLAPRIVDGLVSFKNIESNFAIISLLVSRFFSSLKIISTKHGRHKVYETEHRIQRKAYWTKLYNILFKPLEFSKDIRLDRWLHNLLET
ncbi:nucleotidyltransferase family protein [Candidatus Dojkabacteria bacterium]|nr:nucleotidyltransferase family protein [Candidatus Dojkabacteria bacterium]